ncbi:MAG: NAD-dependent epimerase/dehydratase family protein [Planctomycetes bacterium]|nr:NAD-dependent epimerase/dehydratase family protein [Planctomycetota bacterium]
MPRVVVTGATGFLGRHLLPVLARRYGEPEVLGLSSRDYDLTDPVQVKRMFADTRPSILVHLAAAVGGIRAHCATPADFLYRNTLLTALVFEEAARHAVTKMIYLMGACSYPATARPPLQESQLWNGFPQPESAGYATAKRLGLVASLSYRRQYGLNSVVLIPGNMYGEYDNFRLQEAHVIPAMVRRYLESRQARAREIVMWGTGQPVRDFVYAADVAAVLPYFIDHYDLSEPVNISSGQGTSIRELAETIQELVGFEGDLRWDTTRPDGEKVKVLDVRRFQELGLSCPTPLREGLRRTISWLRKHYDQRSDGLRL